jgi:predicted nucleic acid-binding protein
MNDGYLDTNVVLHALVNDHHGEECRAFLSKLEAGEVRAVLEPYVIHELTYAIPRLLKQLSKAEVAKIVLTMMEWPGVIVNSPSVVVDGVERWASTPGLSFVDAMLAASAIDRHVPIYTKNKKELRRQRAVVPDSLV